MAKDKNYSILGHRHHTTKTLAIVDSHNMRRRHEKNVDPARSHLNRHYVFDLAGVPTREDPADYSKNNRIDRLLKQRVKELGITGLQAGQAVVMEINLTVSPEWMNGKTQTEVGQLLAAQMAWVRKKYANMILTADLHFDETTPHWHVCLIPLDVQRRKVRQSARQKEAGEPVKYTEVRQLSMSKVFTPEALEQAHTELAEHLKPFGLIRGEHRARERNRVRHTTLKEHRALVEQQLPALRAEAAALTAQIEQQKSVLQNIDQIAERFITALKTYYQAAETAPRLADWQRVQKQYEAMPKPAQQALQRVLKQGEDFDKAQIAPHRPKRL